MAETVGALEFLCICRAGNVTQTQNEFKRTRVVHLEQVDAGDRWKSV